MLAGMSVDYYVRAERGNLTGVTEGVLERISCPLRLSDLEHAHLLDLAHAANASRAPRQPASTQRVRPKVQQLLDTVSAPAWIRNGRADFVAGNALGRAPYAPLFAP